MKESGMSLAVRPSLTRKLFNMALEIGDDVINLTLGDPDLLPPEEIRKAACEAVMAGKTRYSANAGLADLRKAYGTFFEKQYGLQIDPLENICVTVGGMEALFLSLSSMVDPGDEVIVLGPYYVNYYEMIHMCGGRAVVVDRLSKTDDELLDNLEESITDKTIAIVINSPCNPAGDILSSALLDGIAKKACEHGLFVISDEVYNSLIYDGRKADSILTRPGMKERSLLVDSCSKRFAMTGWRVGFAVGPEDVIARMVKLQENVAACAPLPSQYAAIRAYSGDVEYGYIREEYEKRRNLVYGALKEMEALDPIRPEATFYCFVDISKTGMDCESFAYSLLEKEHVAVVPGRSYGDAYDSYIRIAFTLEALKLEKAMGRIGSFLGSLS